MNKSVLIAIIAVVVLGGAYFLFRSNSTSTPQNSSFRTPASSQSTNSIPKSPMDMGMEDMGSSSQGQMIMMQSNRTAFSPKEIRAKMGQPVTVHVASQGDHTFTIDELGVNTKTPNGQTTPVEFTPTKKGTFQFYCAIPGHRESGQVGTIIVE